MKFIRTPAQLKHAARKRARAQRVRRYREHTMKQYHECYQHNRAVKKRLCDPSGMVGQIVRVLDRNHPFYQQVLMKSYDGKTTLLEEFKRLKSDFISNPSMTGHQYVCYLLRIVVEGYLYKYGVHDDDVFLRYMELLREMRSKMWDSWTFYRRLDVYVGFVHDVILKDLTKGSLDRYKEVYGTWQPAAQNPDAPVKDYHDYSREVHSWETCIGLYMSDCCPEVDSDSDN